MPTVPVLENQVSATGLRPAQISLPGNGYGRFIEKSGMTEIGKAISDIQAQAKQRGDQVALVEAQRKLDDFEAKNLFDPNTGALSRKGKDAFNIPDLIGNDFDKYGQEIFDGLSNEDQKLAFKKMWLSRSAQMRRTLFAYEREQMYMYAKENNQAFVDSSRNRSALYYNVPEVVDKSITDARSAVRMQGQIDGLPEDAISVKELEAESNIRLVTLSVMADANPQMAINYYKQSASRFTADDMLRAQSLMAPTERKYKASNVAKQAFSAYQPKYTSADTINYVMNDLEGGEIIHEDNDGGTVKYGINSKHNPGVSVADLSEADAREIYKQKYWNTMGIDDMPADMRLVAFDAAVQHGADKDTKKMIEDADGDPRKLIELRRAYYIKLAKDNPEKNGKYLDGWMNRLAKLSAQVDMLRGGQPSMSEMNSQIDKMTDDVDIASDAKQIIKAQMEARRKDIEAREQSASDEAYSYRENGMDVPASVISRMNPKEAVQMRESINKGSEPDPVVYNNIRQMALTGQKILDENGNEIPLSSLRWVLGNKYSEIAGIMSDPSKMVNARTMDQIITSGYGRLLGKTKPEKEAEFVKVEAFRQRVQQDIDALQASSGRSATPDDIQKIVDRNILSVDPGTFSAEKPMFLQDRTQKYEVDGIPNDGKYQVRANGKISDITYDELVSDLIALAEKKGIMVTPENLKDMYERALKSGQLARKYEE